MNSPANNLTTPQLDALLHHPETSHPDAELASLAAALHDLRSSALAAAEHHHRLAIITPHRSSSRTIWTLATAALVFCAAAPFTFHHHPAPTPATAITTSQPTTGISDEVLYADIQADLNASVPDSMLPLTATTTTPSTQRKHNAR